MLYTIGIIMDVALLAGICGEMVGSWPLMSFVLRNGIVYAEKICTYTTVASKISIPCAFDLAYATTVVCKPAQATTTLMTHTPLSQNRLTDVGCGRMLGKWALKVTNGEAPTHPQVQCLGRQPQ
jgi:hypothetical protein